MESPLQCLTPNAVGVKLRLAATESRPGPPTPNGQVSASTPCWTYRVPMRPDQGGSPRAMEFI
jgi:hypothetical protein